ncbi:MATE family efflux transporter [Anaerolentibacter hominis]|uniref:MATE family efflux transporter n=1 Tax=Anaerolentibacter hominis TaxID=3079009 RepID=UPI0031B89388
MSRSIAKDFRFLSLIRFAFPTMIMMIFMSLYTIVDGIFISRFVGTDALSATNIVYPVMNVVLAVGIMLATGGSAVVARKIGEGKIQEARENFTMITIVGAAAGVVISVVCLIFLEPICRALGAQPEIMEYCKNYLSVLLLFVPAYMLQLLFQVFFVTAGKPGMGLILTVLAGVTNGILDYVLIVPAGLGISGAALATVTGYLIPAVTGVIYFMTKRNELHFAKFLPDWKMLRESCLNGSSEMVTNLSMGIVTFLFNILMLHYLGGDGVAAITIVLYTQFLLTALYMGFSMGVAPVISYNYGSKNTVLLKRIFKICIWFIAVSSLVIFGLSLILSGQLVGIFSPKGTRVYEIALRGFWLFSINFIFAGTNMFSSALFTALSNGKVSAFISFLRTFGFITLGLLFLPYLLQADGVWLAVPFAEFATTIAAVICMVRKRKVYHYA